MDDQTHYIYGLFDPDTGEPRYIGITINMEKRLTEHLVYSSGRAKWDWICSLRRQNKRPEMIELARCEGRDKAREIEFDWISKIINAGGNLTNSHYRGFSRIFGPHQQYYHR